MTTTKPQFKSSDYVLRHADGETYVVLSYVPKPGMVWIGKPGDYSTKIEVPESEVDMVSSWESRRDAAWAAHKAGDRMCGYEHHKNEPPRDCEVCKNPLRCGPFTHAICTTRGCSKCSEAQLRACGICRSPSYMCCC